MAILFMDGFETDDQPERWSGGTATPSTSFGRLGGSGVDVGRNSAKLWQPPPLTTDDTRILSLAVYVNAFGVNTFGTNVMCPNNELVFKSDGALRIQDIFTSSGDIESSAGVITVSTWHWIEIEVVFGTASNASVKAWVDGVLEISDTTTATAYATAAAAGTWQPTFGAGAGNSWYGYIDDVVFADGSGSYNNAAPLGELQVFSLLPTGNGNSSALLGSDGNSTDNYLLVDESNPDTADYVASSTEGDKDTYAMENLSDTSSAILGISVESYATKDDAGAKYIRNVVRSGGTDYPQTSHALTTSPSFVTHRDILEEDPDTASAWTATNVNAIEVGPEVRDS